MESGILMQQTLQSIAYAIGFILIGLGIVIGIVYKEIRDNSDWFCSGWEEELAMEDSMWMDYGDK